MKPRIWKGLRVWNLTFAYHPRQSWLFGASEEDRKRIIDNCRTQLQFETWREAIDYLCDAYCDRHIRRAA